MLKRQFTDLMKEAGYRYVSLEELRISLGALVMSTEAKGMSDATVDLNYMYWNSEHNAALQLVPAEARGEFILSMYLEHEQTHLSSIGHLV